MDCDIDKLTEAERVERVELNHRCVTVHAHDGRHRRIAPALLRAASDVDRRTRRISAPSWRSSE